MNKKNDRPIKTFQVSSTTHEIISKYCFEHSLKINPFVDRLLIKSMENLINESTKSRTE